MAIRWRHAVISGITVTAVMALGAGLSAPGPPPSGVPDLAGAQRPLSSTPAGGVYMDEQWGDDDTGEDEKASAATGDWQADHDNGSLYSITKNYGVHDTWGKNDPSGRKITGEGVTVAVVDTGVAPVRGLAESGKVVNGPDLSFESQAAGTRYLDGYGHGTHMAAIIAGRDPSVPAGNENDAKHFVGVAPDARILNMKVATADGGVDVTQVIAAIDWIVQHRNDNGMNVRVINLSYGTHSGQSYLVDPLARAVENAWREGIAVVVAAGNDGIATPNLTMPAMDPYVIAVGAVDHRGTDTVEDDQVASFSNGGSDERRPDLLAPGKSVVSLRVPGSVADKGHPEGLVTGDGSGRFFRGSGTSQAAAVVSGAAALLLQARPSITPDQLKRLLVLSADPLDDFPHPGMGAGVINVKRALELSTPSDNDSRQTWPASTGLGSLESSRGDDHIVDPANGVALTGEVDALGSPWDARSWSSASAAGAAWSGGIWNARSWSGDAWSGASWQARSWSGRSWSGGQWQARSWSTGHWTARGWSGNSWKARSWSSDHWKARSWSGAVWGLSSTW